MPYVCRGCDFFDSDGAHVSGCPSCGGDMRFTMLNPRATATAVLDEPPKPEWHDPYVYGYEEIEAPWSFRYAQIGVGISFYFFVWRWGGRIAAVLALLALRDTPPQKVVVVMGVVTLFLNGAAALGGGGAAGVWARNWIVQGLGVATGVAIIPAISALFFPPASWPFFIVSLVITSSLTILGAYLGHVIVKPTRIPK